MNYYQRLSATELEALKDDFVSFLVVNGIVGSDWEKLKEETPEKAEAFIDQFSEVVYEASLRKARYIMMLDQHHVRCFHCMSEKINMVSLSYAGDEEFDFQDITDLEKLLQDNTVPLEIVSVEKDYGKKREHEMFDMIKTGCKITEGKAYKLLAMYWAEVRASAN